MKPSEIKTVKAKKAHFLLPGFRALMFLGTLYCRKKSDIDMINKSDAIDSQLKCHETIHVRQAENCKDSWVRYYAIYIWQWVCNLPLIFVDSHAPYKFTPFEIEAYTYQDGMTYPNGECDAWRKFKKLSMKERKEYAKKYYSTRRWPIKPL